MSTAEEFRPHYTVEDYLAWEGDWELWNGTPVAMTPSPFGAHAKLLVNVAFALKTAVQQAGCNATVLAEIDWIVDDHTVLRPDVVVLCGSEPDRHVEETPAIVVEILSESTCARDETHKRAIYAREKVPFYFIVDPNSNELMVLELKGDRFEQREATHQAELEVCETCKLVIDVPSIFS